VPDVVDVADVVAIGGRAAPLPTLNRAARPGSTREPRDGRARG